MVRCEKCNRFFFSKDRFQILKYGEKSLLLCPYCVKEKAILAKKLVPSNSSNIVSDSMNEIKFAGLNIDESFHDDYVYNLYFTQNRLFGIYLDSYALSHLDVSSLRNLSLKERLQNKDQELIHTNRSPAELLSSDARNFEIPYDAIKEIRITKLYLVIFLKKPHNLSFIGDFLEFRFWAYSDRDKIIQIAKKIFPDITFIGVGGFLENKNFERLEEIT